MGSEPTYDDLRRLATEMVEDLRATGATPGIEVGSQVPNFTLPNAVGKQVRLADRLAEGPVVVVFYRGAWCPYCDTYLRELRARLGDIRSRGADLLAISPQAPDDSLELSDRLELEFDVLSDLDQSTSAEWGLRFDLPADLRRVYEALGMPISDANADGSWRLPVPATFVLDPSGVVRARHVDPNYLERMEVAAILDALDSASRPPHDHVTPEEPQP